MTDEKKEEKKKEEKPVIFDPKTLTDDQIGQVFSDERLWKHPRFKELTDKAKQADALLKKKDEEESQKLEEEKKFQELLAKEKEKNKKLEEQVATSKVDSAIQTEAVKNGIVDPDVALKLIDRGAIKIGEDGSISGVAEAIKTLVAGKPYLVDATKVNLGSGTPPDVNTGTKIKLSQTQDPVFYKEHEKEILDAMKTNNIEIDIPVGGNMNPS